MTSLRQRMLEDMQVRQLSPATQRSYVGAVARFARHFGRPPDCLSPIEIRAYQVYLTNERRLAPQPILILAIRSSAKAWNSPSPSQRSVVMTSLRQRMLEDSGAAAVAGHPTVVRRGRCARPALRTPSGLSESHRDPRLPGLPDQRTPSRAELSHRCGVGAPLPLLGDAQEAMGLRRPDPLAEEAPVLLSGPLRGVDRSLLTPVSPVSRRGHACRRPPRQRVAVSGHSGFVVTGPSMTARRRTRPPGSPSRSTCVSRPLTTAPERLRSVLTDHCRAATFTHDLVRRTPAPASRPCNTHSRATGQRFSPIHSWFTGADTLLATRLLPSAAPPTQECSACGPRSAPCGRRGLPESPEDGDDGNLTLLARLLPLHRP